MQCGHVFHSCTLSNSLCCTVKRLCEPHWLTARSLWPALTHISTFQHHPFCWYSATTSCTYADLAIHFILVSKDSASHIGWQLGSPEKHWQTCVSVRKIIAHCSIKHLVFLLALGIKTSSVSWDHAATYLPKEANALISDYTYTTTDWSNTDMQ